MNSTNAESGACETLCGDDSTTWRISQRRKSRFVENVTPFLCDVVAAYCQKRPAVWNSSILIMVPVMTNTTM